MEMILGFIGFAGWSAVWQIVFQAILLVVGFVFLVKGADWFVDGAASIATKFGIPQLIIGLTVVALGTSAPEAAVSITAAASGNADITIGNIVGSNILNVFIILGLTALVSPVAVQKSSLVVDIPVVIGISALLLVMGLDGHITRLDAGILIVIFALYLGYLFWDAKKSMSLSSETKDDSEEIKNLSIPKAIFSTVIGLVLIESIKRLFNAFFIWSGNASCTGERNDLICTKFCSFLNHMLQFVCLRKCHIYTYTDNRFGIRFLLGVYNKTDLFSVYIAYSAMTLIAIPIANKNLFSILQTKYFCVGSIISS